MIAPLLTAAMSPAEPAQFSRRTVGRAVEEVMRAKGLNQTDLAGRINSSQPVVNRIVRGRRYPSFDQFVRLSEALGLTVEGLLAACREIDAGRLVKIRDEWKLPTQPDDPSSAGDEDEALAKKVRDVLKKEPGHAPQKASKPLKGG